MFVSIYLSEQFINYKNIAKEEKRKLSVQKWKGIVHRETANVRAKSESTTQNETNSSSSNDDPEFQQVLSSNAI